MRSKFKRLFLLFLLTVILVISLFPYPTQVVAKTSNSSGQPASFQIKDASDFGLDLVVSAPAYQISKKQMGGQSFDTISVPGAYNRTVAGQTELPIASTLVGVPPQAKISIEILTDQSQNIEGKYQISNAPFPARISAEETSAVDQWNYEQTLSVAAANQAEVLFSAVRIADDAWIRDQRVIRLEYSPFEYSPSTGELKWHPQLSVRLHFEYPSGKVPLNAEAAPSGISQDFDALLEDSLLNYEQAAVWRDLPASNSAQITPPNTGPRYRIGIQEDGIYKLTYEELYAKNSMIAGIESHLLQMTSQGDDIAIQVVDNNGIFGPGDYIIFYGQRFYGDRLADLYANENYNYRVFQQQQTDGDYLPWKPQFNATMLEKYTYDNVYWLFAGSSNGLRMQTVNGDPTGNINVPVPHYRKTVRAEESMIWSTKYLQGEDTWYWQSIQATGIVPFTAAVSAPASTGPNAVIRAEFISRYQYGGVDGLNPDHHTKIYFNSIKYGDFYWDGISRYSFEHQLTPATIQSGTNTLGIEALTDGEVTNPSYYFDWFEIEYNRLFVAENNAITFTSENTDTNKYQVSGFGSTSGIQVLDISNPLVPLRVLNPALTSTQVTISLTHSAPLSVAMATGTKSVPSNQLTFYTPPDWAAMTAGVDYIYITHADFIAATQALANYRASSGFSTAVFNIDDLYNEFNFGIFNPIAIKNFLAYTFDTWQTPPTYALLVGDGHWNFHEDNLGTYGSTSQYLPPNLAWVDPWQGEVDSANLLATVIGTDAFPDLIIARLPVNSSAEIDAYRSKLTSYEAPHTPAAWEQNHLFITENADSAGNFPAFADAIIDEYISPVPFANEIRIYEDDYGCVVGSSAECAAVRNAITNTLNINGALIVNYIGHASLSNWSNERIFTPAQFPALTNSSQLPVILSMTCLDGYWSGPITSPGSSMIEEIVRQSNSGAIAAFSPTGLGVSTGHDVLHKGFYDALMDNGVWELGAAAQNAKFWLFETGIHPDLLHTYTIFGDPALQIRNSFGFSASPAISTKFTDTPGTILTHQIVVQNTGTTADRFLIEASNNWATTLPYTITNQIAPGGQVTIPIQVQTPNPGSGSDDALVTITSEGDRSLIFESHLISQIIVELFNVYLPIAIK